MARKKEGKLIEGRKKDAPSRCVATKTLCV
jgi:hypothetical protein